MLSSLIKEERVSVLTMFVGEGLQGPKLVAQHVKLESNVGSIFPR